MQGMTTKVSCSSKERRKCLLPPFCSSDQRHSHLIVFLADWASCQLNSRRVPKFWNLKQRW